MSRVKAISKVKLFRHKSFGKRMTSWYEKLNLLNSSLSERNEAKAVPLIISSKLRGF